MFPHSQTADPLESIESRWGQFVYASLTCLVVFAPLIDGGTTHIPLLVIRLVLLVAASCWFLGMMRGGSIQILRNSVAPSLVALLGWAGCSLWWAPYKSPSAQWLLSLLLYAALFAMTVSMAQSPNHTRRVVTVILGMGTVEGVIGLVQYLWLGEMRAIGTFFNPNFFAAYEGVTLILAMGLVTCARGRKPLGLPVGLLWGIIATTGMAFIVAQSRGAFIALLGALAVLGLFRFGKKALLVLVACLIVASVVPTPLRQRILDAPAQDPYAYTRLEIWKNAFDRIVSAPIGAGLGMYKFGSFQSRFPTDEHIVRYRKRPESAHSEYLQLGVELGVVGLMLFMSGVGVWLKEARRTCQRGQMGDDEGMILGLTGVVLMFLLHAAVDSVFREPALFILLVLSGAIVHRYYRKAFPDTLKWVEIPMRCSKARAAQVVLVAMALAMLCIQPVAAWYAHESGKVAAGRGDTARAYERYSQAAMIDAGTTAFHDAVARTAVQMFQESKESKWLVIAKEEEAIATALNRLDGRFPYRLGTIYGLMASQPELRQQRAEFLDQAAQSFAEAIRADPYTPMSYFELAKLYLGQDREAEAIALLNTAREFEPNFLPGRALLAEVSLRAGLPGNYDVEIADIRSVFERYEHQVRDDIERQFINVDLYPLGRAMAMRPKS